MKHPENVAIKHPNGWVWYDFISRDYGPYATKKDAETKGPLASKREEKWLRTNGKR